MLNRTLRDFDKGFANGLNKNIRRRFGGVRGHCDPPIGEDPFAKVKNLISEMIVKLEKEAEAEATEKAYCDEQMSKTEAKKSELENDIAKLTAKIDKAGKVLE